MTLAQAPRAIPPALAAVGAALLGHWFTTARPAVSTDLRIPLEDKSATAGVAKVDLTGTLTKGDGTPGDLKGAWPGFRGPALDNISPEPVSLLRQLPASGPAKLWEVKTGDGYAGVAVSDGRVYLLDYDMEGKADVLRCLSTTDGKEIWRRGYSIDIGRNHGITRTVCAVANGHVVTFGPKCHVTCVDAVTGDFKWGIDLVREYKAKIPQWYAGQNPLIDGDKVILAPGGESVLLMAVELTTGKVAWKVPNPRKWDMTHCSVGVVPFKGKKLYVYPASSGVVGVWADSGAVAFELSEWRVTMANVPTPLPIPDDRIFLTGGYGAGSMMVKLEETAGDPVKLTPKVLFRLPPEVFGSEQHTPLFHKGYIYGVTPVSAQLVCLGLDGKQVWASGAKYRYGLGPYMIADGMVILINDTGTLSLAEATHEGFKPIASAKVFDHGHEAWGPVALVGGRLFARDMTRLACFDLRKAP